MKHYIGIDLGGTNIVAGVVDEDYNIISRHSSKTRGLERSFKEVVADIVATAEKAVENAAESVGLSMGDISSIGLGTPSCINPKTRLLVHANNMNWRNVPLYDTLEKHLSGKPLYIKNDADCAAFGEFLTGGEYNDALMITLGTGVGGGMIINKKIFNGCDNMGAEMGHTKLVYDGVQCSCGQKGCYESYASATALISQTVEAIERNPNSGLAKAAKLGQVTGRLAFECAKEGDKVALEVIDKYISYVAAGLSTLITIFRPEIVIIGGGIGEQGDFLLKPLNEKIHKLTFAAEEIGVPKAISAKMGNDAGIIGAAMLHKS